MNLKGKLKVEAWNVNTSFQLGKLSNAMREMRRVAEARWQSSGKFRSENMTVTVYTRDKVDRSISRPLDF